MRILILTAIPLFLAACDKGQEQESKKQDPSSAVPASDKGKDPVCGMAVVKAKAKHASFDNADIYFCGDECLKKFNAEPTKYLKICACAKATPPCGCNHCAKKCVPCDCTQK